MQIYTTSLQFSERNIQTIIISKQRYDSNYKYYEIRDIWSLEGREFIKFYSL